MKVKPIDATMPQPRQQQHQQQSKPKPKSVNDDFRKIFESEIRKISQYEKH